MPFFTFHLSPFTLPTQKNSVCHKSSISLEIQEHLYHHHLAAAYLLPQSDAVLISVLAVHIDKH